jgi:RNA polymerase sigma-70 factor (ECF subfamily)
MRDEEFGRAALSNVDMLYNLARRLTPTSREADDLVQETLVRALRGWRRRPPAHVRPWLAAICLDTAAQAGADLAGPSDTADAAMAHVVGDPVHRALWQLTEGEREAIALMDLCGFSAAQTARLTGVPRGTVLARVHSGHKRLAYLLAEVVSGEP